MRFDYLLISFLMISLFAFGGAMMIADMNSQYAFANVSVDNSSFKSVYNATDQIYLISQQATNQTLKSEIEGGSTTIDSMIKGAYTALRLVGSTFSLFTGMAYAVASTLGIPPTIVTIAFTIFIISIIFTLIYMLFRYVSN